MAEAGISIQAPNAVTSSPEGKITVASQDSAFIVHHATDHNEISIMKSDWDEIYRKANAIKLYKKFDWINLLWGAAIPYCIEAINSYRSEETIDFFPLALCFLLIAILKSIKIRNLFKRRIKISVEPNLQLLDTENELSNYIHHDDLLKTLARITKNLESTSSKQSMNRKSQ